MLLPELIWTVFSEVYCLLLLTLLSFMYKPDQNMFEVNHTIVYTVIRIWKLHHKDSAPPQMFRG